ncbi:hypothetical protein KKJ06_17810 [Xenorhabdus bovienii]|uniref:hypothetical protein n=1 Tax=Xenorhabdus bovienii TaxID=40576 RepID=UPI00237C70E4|nr:hypothetical protein [Xenorhabdus bovienii]MDE1484136.1 hypothetical protein [Xenorhabdus bovienii]MDE9442961.1 hypothetical protein [Xenorhabdus bovienii]MDE9557222.1 hypothetical protein [Xenorhabdus bovienii]
MEFKLDLKSNALDSFNEAIKKFKQGEDGDYKAFKFAILHLSHCFELTLKMYIQTLDENLIFSKCYKAVKDREKSDKINFIEAFNKMEAENFDFESIIKGHQNPYTITLSQALSIAKLEKCSITSVDFVDKELLGDIDWMKNLRNSIEHYAFVFTIKDVRLAMGRLVRGLAEFSDIFSLYDLDKEISKEIFNTYNILSDEYEHNIHEGYLDVADARKEAFHGVRPKFMELVNWKEYFCDYCGHETMIQNNDSISGYRCTYCGAEDSGSIEVTCDVCGSEWPEEEMSSWLGEGTHTCPDCRDISSKP